MENVANGRFALRLLAPSADSAEITEVTLAAVGALNVNVTWPPDTVSVRNSPSFAVGTPPVIEPPADPLWYEPLRLYQRVAVTAILAPSGTRLPAASRMFVRVTLTVL